MLRLTLALFTATLMAAPAIAGSYSAKPLTPAQGRIIARDIVWSCGPAACQGATEDSRPAVLCQSLAKRVGRIENFMVDGRAFGQAELDRCNAAVRKAPVEALANAR